MNRIQVRHVELGEVGHHRESLLPRRLPETGLQRRCIDPAADKRRHSFRLSSHLHDRDLVANRIQAKNLQRHFSRQMTAGAKGADGDSFSFQIRRLAHLG